ncbi:RsmD family RNA methyltransferase [Promicromonospora sukumoe]|uniref:16S rRNA (Guanine966-N2)-methyltransferase n=1 Tax=Promicromonospora sukumoe TaxID=88382 RepID=A0A7W3JBB1_9MICO|nr:RsmD family RNA methyltransferase [Promicromonospora sukumoe]MBA8809688.1 16S rRNA (guanine966-N2)-methyltransferase [Promicromonospora sukumoe]
MTRIVAGSVGGRSIAVPAKGTRPTSDRVREAIFSRLEHLDVLDGARVLDLYAGSGALGLEAASRGAVSVILVDSARPAADVARRNVAALGLAGVRVTTETAERYAAGLAGRPAAGPAASAVPAGTAAPAGPAGAGGAAALDLVFLDPPYDLGEDELAAVLTHLAAPGVLADGAVVVVERSTRTPEPAWPDGLAPFARKDYGETAVYYAEPADPEPTNNEPTDAAPADGTAPSGDTPPSDSVGA